MTNGWMKIDSAPKDGTRILLAGMPYGPPVDVGQWGSTTYNRKLRTYNEGWTVFHGYESAPTHWRPLPEFNK